MKLVGTGYGVECALSSGVVSEQLPTCLEIIFEVLCFLIQVCPTEGKKHAFNFRARIKATTQAYAKSRTIR